MSELEILRQRLGQSNNISYLGFDSPMMDVVYKVVLVDVEALAREINRALDEIESGNAEEVHYD